MTSRLGVILHHVLIDRPLVFFVFFDLILYSQQSFIYIGTGVPGLNQ